MFATLELPLRDDSRHKRLKVGRACHPCRMKKIKCDGKQPCMQCKARRRKCMYLKNPDETYIRLDPVNEPQPDVSAIAESYLQDMNDQLKKQSINDDNKIFVADKPDNLFACHNEDHISPLSNPSSSQPATRPDKMIEQLTDGLVRLTLHHDTSKLGKENVTPWRSYGEFIRWTPEPHLPNYYTSSIDMPSRSTQEHLIKVFFDECYHILPTLSRSMFYDQLKVKGPLITPLLLNIIYAHAAKRINNPAFRSESNDPSTQGDLFYNRARRLVDDFLGVPRISTVIALLYMALYDSDCKKNGGAKVRSSRAWMYSGMAIRMCFELGLHTANYSSQMSQFDIELRKRVLWTCFVMDKLESCTMERPWMIKSKDVALDFPTPLPEDSIQERLVLEGFNQLCRLMMLMEKVIHFFTYNIKSLSLWTMNEENQILQFLDAIHQWREMLPTELKWTTPATNPGVARYLPHIPSSAVVSNLHLVCYDLELSLIMCCRYQDEQLHRERRRTLANTITHIVSLTVQHPHLMYNFAISTFSSVFAALTHATDFDNPRLDIVEGAKIQFRKSLEDVRMIVERIPMRDLHNFARLVDLTLQPTTNNSSHVNMGSISIPSTYASAFSAISDLCHKDGETSGTITPNTMDLYGHPDVLETRSGYGSVSPERRASPFHNNLMISGQFAFDACYQQQTSSHSSPSGSVSAAAVAAAAAAVGAVGTPSASSSSNPTNKSIEPADYTFELISVGDEWARSLIY
ncbi:fungal-specific transcription factor domain-containing protein [Gilbertella persicaria]|uniref:fungal-specific transcription factor domain-containing protein n=1 Tax=Gilbertella persicaria TaxID=101096 RepID=UPI0022206767|nr:fungal-specific transcription factor domain-containing protein [Gilbertella persicaria]KAI8078981.1 fungal-specific transcription factor domain-containing protein [Gilbertella persicaria]